MRHYHLFFLLILFGCRNTNKVVKPLLPPQTSGYIAFKNDTNISDSSGMPKDTNVFYQPAETFVEPVFVDTASHRLMSGDNKEQISKSWNIPIQNIKDTLVVDSFMLKMCREFLQGFNQPVLYNYYQHKTVYRLISIPGMFAGNFCIEVMKENDSFYCIAKMFVTSNTLDINEKYSISKKEFDYVDSMVRNSNLINQRFYSDEATGTDAPGFLLEVHNEKGYYYMFRWEKGNEAFENIKLKMLKASDIQRKEQLVYQKKYHGRYFE